MKKLIEELPEGDDAVAWLRLAWSSLACGNKEIEPFLRQVKAGTTGRRVFFKIKQVLDRELCKFQSPRVPYLNYH